MTYWDTSALLKLYVAERDSAYFLGLIAETEHQICSSAMAITEALCALYGKEQRGELKRGAASGILRELIADTEAGRIVAIPYGRDIVSQAEKVVKLAAERTRPVMIRSLDAVHVASALASKAEAMVATDARLRDVAALAGLKLMP